MGSKDKWDGQWLTKFTAFFYTNKNVPKLDSSHGCITL